MDFTAEVSIAVRRNPRETLLKAISNLSEPLRIDHMFNRVIIKPSIYDPSLVGNTNPSLIRALVEMFAGESVFVVESDNPRRTAEQAFAGLGLFSLKSDRVSLVNLSSSPVAASCPPGHILNKIRMPELLMKPHGYLVSAATVKRESNKAVLGAGLKNLFGLIPERDKSVYHEQLSDVIVDLLMAFRPALSVVDLTDVVIGDRESGRSQHIGGVVLGTDPVAVDAFCAGLLGIKPVDIPYIRRAYELGLGEALLDRVRVRGTDHQRTMLEESFAAMRGCNTGRGTGHHWDSE
ncbi:MAG: DUF362 domain-containing protein [Candidatus Thorarchaeota archaeon]|nr:DUF362 domain-containing protein [Candidatus Thorarchaeota archaeon]